MQRYSSQKSREGKFIRRYGNIVETLRRWTLQAKEVNAALAYANLYGEIRTFNHDGVYADDEIEQHVESLAMRAGRVDSQSLSSARGEGVLVLATHLFDYGGHTKVLLTWLELMKDVLPHRLVISESLAPRSVRHLADMAVETVRIPSKGMDAVMTILRAAKGCDRIVLLTHPQDIVSVVATRILVAAGYRAIFYNHADHVFSYGLGVAQTVCEISAYGEAINQRTSRVKGRAVRLGVPVKSLNLTTQPFPEGMRQLDGWKMVLSAGSPYKYKPDGTFPFADFIDALLARRADVKVVLVGPTGREKWWLERRLNWNDRVLFLGILPHHEYLGLLKIADIYVDSYPVTGGTAFPEALLAGKACIGLITPVQGYSLADELKVETPQALVLHAGKILDRDPETMRDIKNIRERVADNQNEVAFKLRVQDIYANKKLEQYELVNSIQQGLDVNWLEAKWRAACIFAMPRKKSISSLPAIRMAWLMAAMMLTKIICPKK